MGTKIDPGGPMIPSTVTTPAAPKPAAPAAAPAPAAPTGWKAPTAAAASAPSTGSTFSAAPQLKVTGKVADQVGNGWPDVVGATKNVFGGLWGKLEQAPGIGNIFKTHGGLPFNPAKVPDSKIVLDRGPRLDAKGLEQAKASGFKGVINLRAENDDDELINNSEKLGLNTLHEKITDNTTPTREQVKQVLDFMHDPANQPCYVHCSAGVGRTGIMVACAEIVDGDGSPQSVEKALEDAVAHGCQLDDQLAFIKSFGEDFINGKVPGYPPPTQQPATTAPTS